MSVHSVCSIKHLNEKLFDYTSKNSGLFQLPVDVLKLIMQKVCDEPSALKSAVRAVEFGRVCVPAHLLTHADQTIDALIHSQAKFDPFVGFLSEKIPCWVVNRNDGEILKTLFNTGMADQEIKKDPGLTSNYAPSQQVVLLLGNKEKASADPDFSKVYYEIFNQAIELVSGKKYIDVISSDLNSFADQALTAYRLYSDPQFLLKCWKDMIGFLANQPLENITIDEFNRYLKAFENSSDVSLPFEQMLCDEIRGKHDPVQFASIIKKYAHPSEELLTKMKEQHRAALNSELDDVKEKIKELCDDDVIEMAYAKMKAYEDRKDQAESAYVDACTHAADKLMNLSDAEFCENEEHLKSLFQDYQNWLLSYHAAQHDLQKLENKLAKLAVWDENDVIVGGKAGELEAHLQDETRITEEALAKCHQISEFYSRLSQPFDKASSE